MKISSKTRSRRLIGVHTANLGHFSQTVLCSGGVLLFCCQLFLPLFELLLQYGHWVSFLRGLEMQTYAEKVSPAGNQVPERSTEVTPGRCPPLGECPSSYRVPSALNDASFLGQDLDEPVSLSFAERHAAHSGDQSLEGQIQRRVGGIRRRRRC